MIIISSRNSCNEWPVSDVGNAYRLFEAGVENGDSGINRAYVDIYGI